MNTLILEPNDVLFFRDGRPMSGALSGHGAAWPLPGVIDGALHAAMYRADLKERSHPHRFADQNGLRDDNRGKSARFFGSLVSAGPFPVSPEKHWYFQRPADILNNSSLPALAPDVSDRSNWKSNSSLPRPLSYALMNRLGPNKEGAKKWFSLNAFESYLKGEDHDYSEESPQMLNDGQIFDTEESIGIAIDPATGTAAEHQIYSSQYLRLKCGWKMGVFAYGGGKDEATHKVRDLVGELFPESRKILVGGQQRLCSVSLEKSSADIPLPYGLWEQKSFDPHRLANGRYAVKWILLAPAIWPEICGGTSARGVEIKPHCGGWLPNWIDMDTGKVLLKHRTGVRKRGYNGKGRPMLISDGEETINARLVSAAVSKPIVVTGWAGAVNDEPAGASTTHLAVPAGAVYYFEADSPEDAANLASALSWHAGEDFTTIHNRRSTLLGEKGFGIGVCGTWKACKQA